MGSSRGFPRPRSATARTDRPTFGPSVAQVARGLGYSLMPWQQHVCDVALEHVAGRLAYRDVGVSVPRQSGKSSLVFVWVIYRMLSAAGQKVVYGAQTRLACRGKLLDDWWPRLARSPLADLFSISRVNGSEALRASNGSMLSLLSNDETAGHGQTIDLAILDEAWSLDHRAEQSARPAMATKVNAQLILTSTAGTERSTYWNNKVASGRTAADAGITDGMCWFEWSAPADADITDPQVWHAFHPALGHTIDESVIAADLAAMDIHQFRRAYGNLLSSDSMSGWQVISRDAWERARW